MPPLPRNIQINCYSNQPSFVPYRAVRFNERVYSNCNKNSITFYSKQPNLPKCAHICTPTVYTQAQKSYFSLTSNDQLSYPSGLVATMTYTILVTLSGHTLSAKNLSAHQGHILDRIYSFVSVWNGCSLLRFTITGTAHCVTVTPNTINGASFHHSTGSADSTPYLFLISLATV